MKKTGLPKNVLFYIRIKKCSDFNLCKLRFYILYFSLSFLIFCLIVLYRLRSLPQLSHFLFCTHSGWCKIFYIVDVPIFSVNDITVI